MKIIVCLLFLSCKKEEQEQYERFSFNACGCGCDEFTDGFTWPKKLSVWDYTDADLYDPQIPENILSSLSTKDLVEICFQYPYLSRYLVYNDWNSLFEAGYFSRFNGYRELYQRKGVVNELLKLYQEMLQNIVFLCGIDPGTYDQEKFAFHQDISNLEILLSRHFPQDDDAKKLNYKKILQSLVVGYEARTMYPDFYDNTFRFSSNFYARAHVITIISPQSRAFFSGTNRVFREGFTDKETMDLVNELSYKLIE